MRVTDGLRQLKHLIALAETKNFHRAAERLQLSQQAVSKSLMQLERSLGIKLVDRDRQSVSLTPFGELLLPHAQAVTAEIRQFEDGLAMSLEGRTGRVRIGATPTLLDDIVPSTLARFYRRYPDTIGTVERGDYDTLERGLLQGQLDLVLSTSPEKIETRLVVSEQLCEDRNVILVRKDHPLDSPMQQPPERLLDFPRLAMLNFKSADQFLTKLFAPLHRAPPAADLATSADSFVLSWLQQTDFYCVAPYRLFARHLQHGPLAAVAVALIDEAWPLIMVTRRRATRAPALTAYMEVLRAFFAEAGASATP